MKNFARFTVDQEARLRRLWADPNVTMAAMRLETRRDELTLRRAAERLGLGPKAKAEFWTAEIIEAVTRRYLAGEGATEIAASYCVTRNTILGKISRLGVIRPVSVKSRSRVLANRRAPVAKPVLKIVSNAVFAEPPPRPPRAVVRGAEFDPLPGSTPVIWTSRAWNQCNWPIEGLGEIHSCGLSVHKRGWCAEHWQRGTSPSPKKSLNNDRLRVSVKARFA